VAGHLAAAGDGTIAVPLGLAVFRRGERYAKQHGRLKRSG